MVAIVFGITQRPFVERLSLQVFDLYQRLQPRQEAGGAVVVIDIDETSIARVGQWPWPRTTVGALVDRLGQLGAATVALDIVFSDPDRTSLGDVLETLRASGVEVTLPASGIVADNDAALAEAIGRNSVTVGIAISNETAGTLPLPKSGFAFGGADPKSYLPDFRGGVVNLPELSASAAGMGFFSFPPSTDGIVRNVPIISLAQGQLYPSLAAEALRVVQGASTYAIRSTGASGEADTGRPAMVALRVGAFDVPTGPAGDFWVYFSGLPTLDVIPAADVLESDDDAALSERIGGRIALIGTSAVGLRDLVATPLRAGTPGVEVHAEIIDQILSQVFLTRPDWAVGAEVFAAVLLGLILVLVASHGNAIISSAAAAALVLIAFFGSWEAFAQFRLLLDPLLATTTVLLVFAVTMPLLLLLTDRERQFVRNAFSRYLAPTLVERLASDPGALALGGETRELTVLFTDIRGFTSISEALDPQQLTALLNSFLTPMTDILLRAEATIDKYMGDAIMAFWNAPLDIAGHQRKACIAALEMVQSLDALNAGRDKPLKIGIGINSGECVVGNLGSAQRFSYSAVGDGVNLASRVEGQTKAYGASILVTEMVREPAGELAFIEMDKVRVVGRREPVRLFSLLGDETVAASESFQQLRAAVEQFLAAYRSADPDAAEHALSAVSAMAPPELEVFCSLYRERIDVMRIVPPPPGWDGVFEAKSK